MFATHPHTHTQALSVGSVGKRKAWDAGIRGVRIWTLRLRVGMCDATCLGVWWVGIANIKYHSACAVDAVDAVDADDAAATYCVHGFHWQHFMYICTCRITGLPLHAPSPSFEMNVYTDTDTSALISGMAEADRHDKPHPLPGCCSLSMHMVTWSPACIFISTYICTYICTYIHTYIHS
ncbi:hypothetical protein K504DRAFT_302906 [Pleomassaria siparia CBS 279.74]|uniref:Uncharacterized protein n=1 Tax=Pleomassaria siparia CBS 279.74 TaxID=1314801 RepID=A0A6G1K6N3_9PLEO|nr:hypothetical protein K504DRAFT_302906 [Pleomassaria siparia CBS 279.74]